MEPVVLLDSAGRRRSAATMPGHRRGQAPRNKGMRYPADPPTVEEIVLVMPCRRSRHGLRLRGLIVVMRRAGLRISETLALTESDLDADRDAILVRVVARSSAGARAALARERSSPRVVSRAAAVRPSGSEARKPFI